MLELYYEMEFYAMLNKYHILEFILKKTHNSF
jgi:hypothetical protein